MSNSELQAKRTECIIYSRVVGWINPVKNFNPGKVAERNDRVNFKV
jgi:anaerobic ribonucleoside-triphosphate reductase